MGLRHWGMAVVAAAAVGTATMVTMAGKAGATDMLTLDIQAGEPFGDALARSTMQTQITVPLGMQGVPLPVLGDWNGDRYQLRLQGGEDRNAVIPWTPAGGTIWLQGGVVTEIDLTFVNPDKTRADADDWQQPLTTLGRPPATPDQVADSLIAIYAALQALKPAPVDTVSCGENLPVTEAGNCDGTTILSAPLTPERIRQAVTALHADYQAALAQDPAMVHAPGRRLVLGQWWLPNGNLVMLAATTALDTAPDKVALADRPVGLEISLNIKEFFRSGLGRLIEACYDQQALLPQAMAYTPQQAAQVFHGLFADFYPPTVDGKTVTDMVALQRLDWAQLTDAYWNDAETRREFCTRLDQLQRDAGYTGPVAPLR